MSEIYTEHSSEDDDYTPSNPTFLARGRVLQPDGSAIVPLHLDANIARFIDAAHLDYQLFLTGVLKAYVESQQKNV